MTEEVFLRDPLSYLFSQTSVGIPTAWIQVAWQRPDVVEEAVFALSRSISKVGNLGLAEDWLSTLRGALTGDQAASLYSRLRDSTERSESEWRAEFEVTFPQSKVHLPPIDHNRELFNRTVALFIAIYWGDADKTRYRAEELLKAGFSLDAAILSPVEFSRFPEGQDCLQVLEATGHSADARMSALSLARFLQHEDLVQELQNLGAIM